MRRNAAASVFALATLSGSFAWIPLRSPRSLATSSTRSFQTAQSSASLVDSTAVQIIPIVDDNCEADESRSVDWIRTALLSAITGDVSERLGVVGPANVLIYDTTLRGKF